MNNIEINKTALIISDSKGKLVIANDVMVKFDKNLNDIEVYVSK